MPAPESAEFFQNFTKMTPRVPAALWHAGRLAMMALTMAIAVALILWPQRALPLFWGFFIPVLPVTLVAAPGLWRQVCPMAFANQVPRMFGFSRALDLPEWARSRAFAVAVILFTAFVFARAPLLNHAGPVLGLTLIGAVLAAFAGGLVFKGRSGWCGTFCPLGPIQRSYGQAPLAVVRNGFCPTCVGCQKNCYDFNPRAAVFSDVFDDDPRYASQRRLFMGLLPGLVLGFFLQGSSAPDSLLTYWEGLALFCAASIGLYSLALSFTRIDAYRVSLLFSAAALVIFYWFAGPSITKTVSGLFSLQPPDVLIMASRGIGFAAALALALSGLRSQRRYEASKKTAAQATFSTDIKELTRAPMRAGGRLEATDRESGASFPVSAGATLLDAIQTAGLKINYGCRSGFCGADAVAILEGADNLSPPNDDETATLRRLGLEGKARLACVCQVKGPVLFDRNPKAAASASPGKTGSAAAAAPRIDRAAALGIGKVVIIGNGVAGSTAAQALRAESASTAITLVTNEPAHFYNRMAVGRLIYDPAGQDHLQLVPESWFGDNNVAVLRNTVAAKIDRAGRRVVLATGQALEYDRLILATGARAALPAPDFLERSNAFVLRSLDDAQAIRTYAQSAGARRAVVIGGGVLGVEAAEALQHLGLQVILLQRADRLMNAQLDEAGSQHLRRYLENIGIQVVTSASVTRFEGQGRIRSAWLSHGPRVSADLFVACLGVQPNVLLAQDAGLATGRGIKVDASMRTSDTAVYAVGDVAEPEGMAMAGLWPLAAMQAELAVAAMLGDPKAPATKPNMLRLKSEGIDLFCFGDPRPRPGAEVWTARPGSESHWSVVADGDRPSAGVFTGPPGSGKIFSRLLQESAGAEALSVMRRDGQRLN